MQAASYEQILSPNMTKTPEGYLLCENVPVARTGVQLYAAYEVHAEDGEAPIKPVDGVVRVRRTADEVFSPAFIKSLNGRPVTVGHVGMVTKDTWNQHAAGVILNPRRGVGMQDDLLVCDLLVTGKQAQRAILDEGIRQISLGYEAKFVSAEDGFAEQRGMYANHAAVLLAGKCGKRCAIGDSTMKLTRDAFTAVKDRVLNAFTARDEARLKLVLDEAMPNDDDEYTSDSMKRLAQDIRKFSDVQTVTNDRLTSMDARIKAIEDKRVKDEDDDEEAKKKKKKEEEDDKADGVKDSAELVAFAQDVKARCEILSPGIAFPALDSAQGKRAFLDALCGLKRQALSAALINDKMVNSVKPMLGGKTVAALTCDQLQTALVGASEVVKALNNSGRGGVQDRQPAPRVDMNKKNEDFWKKNGGLK